MYSYKIYGTNVSETEICRYTTATALLSKEGWEGGSGWKQIWEGVDILHTHEGGQQSTGHIYEEQLFRKMVQLYELIIHKGALIAH